MRCSAFDKLSIKLATQMIEELLDVMDDFPFLDFHEL
jgi:hypothetical protein